MFLTTRRNLFILWFQDNSELGMNNISHIQKSIESVQFNYSSKYHPIIKVSDARYGRDYILFKVEVDEEGLGDYS